MGTISIAYPNRAATAVVSGGSWQTPVTCLLTRPLGEVARSASLSLAATRFDIDLQRLRAVSFIALVNHSFSIAARVRITMGSTAGGADLYNSGWLDAWPPVRNIQMQSWRSENWWNGKLTDEERQQYPSDFTLQLPSSLLTRYMRVEIDDAANAAGYVEIGMLFVADAWQPVVNVDLGGSLLWQDKTAVEETEAGLEFFGQKARRRRASFRLSHLTTDEAMSRAFDLDGTLGISGDLYYITDTDDILHRIRRSFLGRLEQTSEINHAGTDRYGKQFTIIERIA